MMSLFSVFSPRDYYQRKRNELERLNQDNGFGYILDLHLENELCLRLISLSSTSLISDMCAFPVPVDTFTFTTVINCCYHLNRMDYAFSLLTGILKRGLLPDVVTYTTLIRGLMSQDKPVEAGHLLKKLIISKEIQPDVVTYTTVIDGLCKKGHTYMAVTLFKFMVKKGCKPDIVTYSVLIDSLCKDRLVDQALGLQGLTPTIETYCTVLHGLFRTGRHVEARKFYRKEMMLNKGLKLDIATCNTMVDGLFKNRYVDEALSLFHLMQCNGLSPHISTYNILIDGLCKNGHLEKARNILDNLPSKGLLLDNLPSKGLRYDVKKCTIMIQGFCRQGLLDEANELFRKMEANNCFPDGVTYNTLIRGCYRNKKYTEASVLIDEMRARGFSADASTSSVLVDLLKSKEQDPALHALQKRFLS